MTVGTGGATARQLLHGSPYLPEAVFGLQDKAISAGLVKDDVEATIAQAFDPQAAR